METLTSGTIAGAGSFRCQQLRLRADARRLGHAHGLPGLRRRGLRPRLPVPRRALTPAKAEHEDTLARRRGERRCRARAETSEPSATRCWPKRESAIEQPGEYLVYEESGEWRTVALDARVDAHRTQPRGRRALRRPDRLAPPRADRAPARRRARARRPQPQRRVRERRADRGQDARGRRRDPRRALPAELSERRSRPERSRRDPAAIAPTAGPRARSIAARMANANGHTIAVLSQKGGTGKTTTVRTLTDVAAPRRACATLAVDLDPQGNLSDYFDVPPDAEPTIADVLSGRAKAAEAIHEDLIPANLSLAEAELMLGGKMGRELTLRRALAKAPERLRGDPDRLPAVARPADGQRARRRRSRAGHRRGPVLRAAGRRAGDGGGRARARQPEPRAGAAGRAAEPRRHAHRALARGARVAEGALRRAGLRHGRPLLDRLRRVGRAREVDPRPPPRPRRRLPRARRRSAGAPAGASRPRASSSAAASTGLATQSSPT